MAEQLLKFDPGLMIWTVVVFVLTLVVLSKVAWGPLMKALDDREKRIHDALTKAEQAQRAAEEAITQARNESDVALRKADALVKEARVEAQHMRQKMVDEAKAESQKTVEEGLNRIAAEQRIAMAEIRRTTADLAIRAAARLVKSSMSEQQQRQIVQDFLGDLPADSTKTVQ
jgi:F-type H+-transporting ATPase subunit b